VKGDVIVAGSVFNALPNSIIIIIMYGIYIALNLVKQQIKALRFYFIPL